MTFHEIYEQHHKAVFNLALQYVQNASDAEEITQEVFLQIYRKLHVFEHRAELSTWIYRITVNKSIDHLRKIKRIKHMIGFFPFLADVLHVREPSMLDHPGAMLENKEALKKIYECINRLPARQKTVIILLKIQGLRQADAASIMGLTEKALESLLQRARKNLKKFLDDTEEK
jgi:RNA polymerase sigma-70 factor (ECF subfamily)